MSPSRKKPHILLITPPLTQLNTTYPATTYLTGFLRERGYECHQADASLELAHRVFSKKFLKKAGSPLADYVDSVDAVMKFLANQDSHLPPLPEGPRLRQAEKLIEMVTELDPKDEARFYASLYLDDLADLIGAHVDEKFQLTRYGETLAASAPRFDAIMHALQGKPTLVDEELDALTKELLDRFKPQVVGFSVPFPGNVYGAFRMAQVVRAQNPKIKTIMGGGYVNTELRSLKEPRVFDFMDFITFDDGEAPFLAILEHLEKPQTPHKLLRTMVRDKRGEVTFITNSERHDVPQKDCGMPTTADLPLHKYLSLLEMLNPMHRLWSETRWNKLTLAHGCYWKKCNFCDTTLDYIGRYETSPVDLTIARMEALIAETGQTGFHFVDEAAPPAVLKALARKILERGLQVSWWGNVRFDKTFTPEVCELLAASGCIAVSGGLEVASDRLLALMQKGVSVAQVARVTKAFTDAGIMVHAYLMYGFPTQTAQETVDALEMVRQLFEAGCLQSAYWHRFSATAHSPIGKNPNAFGIQLLPEPAVTFARNDLEFEDPTGCDHGAFSFGLKKALYNYMHGVCLDLPAHEWFEFKVPRTTVPRSFIARALTFTSQSK